MKYFKGLAKCQLCGKNYNIRNERGNIILICGGKKNYGASFCPDSPRIKVNDLIYIIEQHCKIYNKDYDITKTKHFVKNIEISNEKVIIYYKDGTKSIWTKNEIIF